MNSAEKIFIRDTVKETDIKTIEKIVRSSGYFNEEEIQIAIELIEERLKKGIDSGYHFNFLEVNNETIGYICFGRIPLTKSSFDLYWIAIDEKYRGKGYGKYLLSYGEGYMKKLGALNVYVETSTKKQYKSTRIFYKKMKYKKVAIFKNFYDKGDGKIVFYKKLS